MLKQELSDEYFSSNPFNLTQQPAASVPCGFATFRLPISMQIVGTKYSDVLYCVQQMPTKWLILLRSRRCKTIEKN